MVIAERFMVAHELITPDARLVEDLGGDSLNVLEVVLDINEALDIELPTEGVAQMRKVKDLNHLVSRELWGDS
ncbi:hypothetical protein PflCFBP13517_25655 [Pseudomonas fluorescens]|nr:hypothetical protein PflCFBP13517_25655 [Pseudomonas fluorescens]